MGKVENAIVEKLKADPTLVALIGKFPNGRIAITGRRLPEEPDGPYIMVGYSGGDVEYNLGNTENSTTELIDMVVVAKNSVKGSAENQADKIHDEIHRLIHNSELNIYNRATVMSTYNRREPDDWSTETKADDWYVDRRSYTIETSPLED